MHEIDVNQPTHEAVLFGRDLWMMFVRGGVRAMQIQREVVQREAFMKLVHGLLHVSPLRAHDKKISFDHGSMKRKKQLDQLR